MLKGFVHLDQIFVEFHLPFVLEKSIIKNKMKQEYRQRQNNLEGKLMTVYVKCYYFIKKIIEFTFRFAVDMVSWNRTLFKSLHCNCICFRGYSQFNLINFIFKIN